MSYPLLRRLPLGTLDRQVARASMQICHKIYMQQIYISRVNAFKQWVVVSNPSDECVDLTDFSLSCSGCNDIFRFPESYTLLSGDEVTVWCSPRRLKLGEETLLQPYLFWTQGDGSLRQKPFFSPARANEVILFDPLLVEVASLRVTVDGEREFRVLHCKSVHEKTLRHEIDTRFCIGCLSPLGFNKQTLNFTYESGNVTPNEREIYVFSRYRGVVSDKSLLKHILAVILVPLVESARAVLLYLMLSMFQLLTRRELGPPLRPKVTTLLLLRLVCDIMARRLVLWIKSGLLVTIASFTSVVLDQVAVLVVYLALQRLYPVLSTSFQYMLLFDLGVNCTNAAAVHVRLLDARWDWHPLFKQLAQWDHQYQGIICTCGIGRELWLHSLLLLAFTREPSPWWKAVVYSLMPLFTAASGIDYLRALATLLHMLRFPQRRQTYDQRDTEELVKKEPEKESPLTASSTPKMVRL